MRTAWLVTGGAGFIGSHFIRLLQKERPGDAIVCLDKLTYAGNPENLAGISPKGYTFVRGDICDGALAAELLQRHSVGILVNFAAESHVDRSISSPGVFVQTNVAGTLALLEAARSTWQSEDDMYREGTLFVQVSTDEVYGALTPEEAPFTEEHPLAPRSPYAASKAGADLLAKSFWDTYRLPVIITRCSNNYGPHQHPEKLIPQMIRRALAGEELPLYGDGGQIRDWLHVEDHCRAILLAATRGIPGRVYNIGGNNERANLELVRQILSLLRQRGEPGAEERLIRHVQDRKGHDRRYAVDAGRIRAELGWRPQVPFAQGLADTVGWYCRNR